MPESANYKTRKSTEYRNATDKQNTSDTFNQLNKNGHSCAFSVGKEASRNGNSGEYSPDLRIQPSISNNSLDRFDKLMDSCDEEKELTPSAENKYISAVPVESGQRTGCHCRSTNIKLITTTSGGAIAKMKNEGERSCAVAEEGEDFRNGRSALLNGHPAEEQTGNHDAGTEDVFLQQIRHVPGQNLQMQSSKALQQRYGVLQTEKILLSKRIDMSKTLLAKYREYQTRIASYMNESTKESCRLSHRFATMESNYRAYCTKEKQFRSIEEEVRTKKRLHVDEIARGKALMESRNSINDSIDNLKIELQALMEGLKKTGDTPMPANSLKTNILRLENMLKEDIEEAKGVCASVAESFAMDLQNRIFESIGQLHTDLRESVLEDVQQFIQREIWTDAHECVRESAEGAASVFAKHLSEFRLPGHSENFMFDEVHKENGDPGRRTGASEGIKQIA